MPDNEGIEDGATKRGPKELPDKVFALRNSYLTDLFATNHFQAIEHLITTVLLYVTLSSVVSNYVQTGRVFPNTDFLTYAFVNYETGFCVWLKLVLATLTFHPLVRVWAHFRASGANFGRVDGFFVLIYFSFQAFFVSLTYDTLFKSPTFGPATAMAVSFEQVRLVAKMHAFAREMLRKNLQSGAKENSNAKVFPPFTWYLYFLMVPTLVYRDSYPRSPTRRWSCVLLYFIQFLGCLVLFYIIFDRLYLKEYDFYLSQPAITKGMLLATFVSWIAPSLVLFHVFFFSFFQCWSNMWAELLRFGDRLFYVDFWNSTDGGEYMRKWNFVVRDWLYTYCYKETYDLRKKKGGKILPAMVAFAASTAFHEFVMVATVRFYLPIFLVSLSGAGMIAVTFKQPKVGGRWDNLFLYLSLAVAHCSWFIFYFYEIAARKICGPNPPHDYDNAWLAPPRFWTCFPTNQ